VSFTSKKNLMNIDKVISILRSLKEESGPTNVANAAGLGFDPNTETPPVFKKKKNYLYMKGSRKLWSRNRSENK